MLVVGQFVAPSAGQAFGASMMESLGDEVAKVSEKVRPAVVRIISTSAAKQHDIPMNGLDQFFGPGFRERLMPQQDVPVRGLGSGFIIEEDGVILTNSHVVADSDELEVILDNGDRYEGEVVGADADSEVAVVKIDAKGLPTVPLGNSDDLRVGHFVMAFGSPQWLSQSVTLGIVSALNRSELQITEFSNFIQTDAAINRGNSGGPLVNVQGEVVGICTAIISTSGGSQGLGLAIPMKDALRVADDLREKGVVERGYLGVMLQDLSAYAEHLNLRGENGALVSQVFEDSPAHGELEVGDAVISLDGQKPRNMMDLRNQIASKKPGDSVKLGVVRDGEEITVRVKLGQRPSSDEIASVQSRGAKPDEDVQIGETELGFSVRDLTPDLAEQMGFDRDQEGVLVTKVDNASKAARQGLTPGVIIEQANGQKIGSVEDLDNALDSAKDKKAVMLLVRDTQGTRFVLIEKD